MPKIKGVLTAINSERDLNGNTYWAMTFTDTATGKTVQAQISGGESNIYAILRYWGNPNDWDRSIMFQTKSMKKREFHKLVKTWPYAGCNSEELATFLKNALKGK
jgi:hypothetical protein